MGVFPDACRPAGCALADFEDAQVRDNPELPRPRRRRKGVRGEDAKVPVCVVGAVTATHLVSLGGSYPPNGPPPGDTYPSAILLRFSRVLAMPVRITPARTCS